MVQDFHHFDEGFRFRTVCLLVLTNALGSFQTPSTWKDRAATWSAFAREAAGHTGAALLQVFLKGLVLFSLRTVSMRSSSAVAAMQEICSLILRHGGRGAERWFCNMLCRPEWERLK